MATDTIAARLFGQEKQRPNAPAYYAKRGGKWVPATWKDYAGGVRAAAKSLMALGFEPGDTVCILGFNRPEWVILDLAAMTAGGAPAGIYTTCSPSEVRYIVDHAESAFVLVEDVGQWEKIAAERTRLPKLRHVILLDGAVEDPLVIGWDDFLTKGAGVSDADVQARVDGLEDDQVATLIYTSGTTGPPKAVMLSHRNLAWTASTARDLVSLGPDDCNVSYLPLSHIAEQMFTLHAPITVGSAVYFAESLEKLPQNLAEVQPTVVFAVPRVWEKFHAKVSAAMSEASGLKARILAFARRTGTEVTALKAEGKAVTGLTAFKYAIANKLVLSKLKPKLGLGRARVCVSGAAPIGREVLDFFASLDLTILEVYGQSEDTGPTTFNLPGRTRLGTVGPRLPGVEVKIAEDGEILVKGPNVFLGYYKDPEATAESLVDGWLHSGDLGAFDADGFLSITGRKKEIIITAGGKNIAPKNIEAALKNLELVAQAVVIGDRRKYLSALVTLDPDAAAAFAKQHGIPADSVHEAPALIAEIQKGVDAVNAEFARVEHIRKFTVLGRDFTVEAGELTPTMKIKRRIIHQTYADAIEAMYEGA